MSLDLNSAPSISKKHTLASWLAEHLYYRLAPPFIVVGKFTLLTSTVCISWSVLVEYQNQMYSTHHAMKS